MAQMVKFFKALQDFALPESITEYGGVTFADSGPIVSTFMTSVVSRPWPSYEAHFRDRLQLALQSADANGVRQRLAALFKTSFTVQFKSLESNHDKAIVHADFTPHNLLYDATSQRITASIDYDFAYILHLSYEFLRSFSGAGGQFQGWYDVESSEQTASRDAKRHGFSRHCRKGPRMERNGNAAKDWEDELEKLNVKRPRTMKGIEKVVDVDAVLRSILPWRISSWISCGCSLNRLF